MWRRDTFGVATDDGVKTVTGMVANGLGLRQLRQGAIFGPRPVFQVVHLGSGHTICMIEATPDQTAKLVAEMLQLTETWEFDGLTGWQNIDPDLSLKVQDLLTRHAAIVRTGASGPDDFLARKIARERA